MHKYTHTPTKFKQKVSQWVFLLFIYGMNSMAGKKTTKIWPMESG